MKKKIVSLLLVAAMVLSLVACGGKEEATENVSSETEDVSETAETGDEGPAAGNTNFNATGYPIVNEPVTITIMAAVASEMAGELENNEAIKYVEELTGVNIEITAIPKEEYSERLSVTLADDPENWPDIILSGLEDSDISNNLMVGNLVDLAPYIEYYGENIKQKMEEIPTLEKYMKNDDGQIGYLATFAMTTETGKCPQSLFYINQNWLDNLGLKTPATAEEYLETLIAFRDDDPNGNGEKDEIPLLPRTKNDFYYLTGLYGVTYYSGNCFWETEDGIEFIPYMDEFKPAISFLAELYQEGLVNSNVFEATTAEVLAMGSESDVVGSTVTAASFTIVGSEEERLNSLSLLTDISAEGYDYTWLSRALSSSRSWFVTSACEYPEVALRLADYFYSDEGARMMWMGTEDNYTWSSDNSTWTWNLAEEQTVEQLRATGTLQTSLSNWPAAYAMEWFSQESATEGIANEHRYQMGTENADSLRRQIPDGLTISSENVDEAATLKQDITSYVDTTVAQFIVGELDIEKDWDAFIQQCETLQVERYLEILNEAYQAYLAK